MHSVNFDSCSRLDDQERGRKVPAPVIRRGSLLWGWEALATRPKRDSRLPVALTCPLSVRSESSDA